MLEPNEIKPLRGQVALVAGATRGAGRGVARMLGAAGATVYCTGRSSRATGGATPGRPETIEETAELVDSEGGTGIAVRVDHTVEEQVASLIERIKNEEGRLDILVNDIWGGDALMDWSKRFWEIDIGVMRTLMERAVFSHLITARHAAPLMVEQDRGLIVEVTDGYTNGYRGQIIYDLVKSSNMRLSYAMAWDLAQTGVTALTIAPGFLRSEHVLETLGVTEANWRDAIARDALFAESETPCFVGRVIAALACDPNLRLKAGRTYSTHELAKEFGVTDIDGHVPAIWDKFDSTADELLKSGKPLEAYDRFFAMSRYCQIHHDPTQSVRATGLAEKLGIGGAGIGLQPATRG
jgi:NAD(P)-dependent dehydrogenase (short-subunit alcohol dehydrogenase family)